MEENTEETIETRRKRLLHRATYRGFKEADIVIGGFAKAYIHEMSDVDLDEFEELISFSDKQIYDWIMGKQEPPSNMLGPIFLRMQKFDAAQAVRDLTAL